MSLSGDFGLAGSETPIGLSHHFPLDRGDFPVPDFEWDFKTASLVPVRGSGTFVVTRASSAWVRDPVTGLITTLGNNVAAFNRNFVDGITRLRSDEAKTQYLGGTAAPATQTTSALNTGLHVLWVEGTGSAAVSAGTATITGAGTAVQGAPVQFNVTGAGTVVVTVSGSLVWFQLENGAQGTGYILNAGAPGTTVSRVADVIVLNPFTLTTPCTILVKGMMQVIDGTLDATARNLVTISDGTVNELYRVQRNASAQVYTPIIIDGGVSQISGVSRSIASNVLVASAIAIATNDFAIATNGLAVQTDTSVTLPTVNRIHIGVNHTGTTSWWNAGIESLAIWNSRLPNDVLPLLARP